MIPASITTCFLFFVNDEFIVVLNDEHFTTMVQNGEGTDAWEQRDGQVEDDIFEKLAIALGEYIDNQ